MKYLPAKLPASVDAARAMAEERRQLAKEARDRDLHGTAKVFELMALLLDYYADTESKK